MAHKILPGDMVRPVLDPGLIDYAPLASEARRLGLVVAVHRVHRCDFATVLWSEPDPLGRRLVTTMTYHLLRPPG